VLQLRFSARTFANGFAVAALLFSALLAQAQPSGPPLPPLPPLPGRTPPPPAPPSPWQRCAGQDEVCRVNGEALVRYGAEGRYAYKLARNRIICDHQEFGDPAFGVHKQCDVTYSQREREGVRLSFNDWVPCGNEGEDCRFNGTARVRYGVDGRYAYRNASNGIRCSVGMFGDLAFGQQKSCDYQLQRGRDYGRDERDWDYCASEDGFCAFSGPGEVRYGTKGRFVVRRGVNGMPCKVDTFGSDPAYGEPKHCFVHQGSR
jgi:hypothetical protein